MTHPPSPAASALRQRVQALLENSSEIRTASQRLRARCEQGREFRQRILDLGTITERLGNLRDAANRDAQRAIATTLLRARALRARMKADAHDRR